MKTILNFFRNLFFNSESDMIGLATIKTKKPMPENIRPQSKKEYTLTEMLKRTY